MGSRPRTGRRRGDASGGLLSATPAVPSGLNVGAGSVVVVIAALLAGLVPAAGGWRLVLMVASVAGFAGTTGDAWASAAVAGIGFLVTNGFLVDRFGELRWHAGADEWRLVAFAAAAAAGLGGGAAVRVARRWQARPVPRTVRVVRGDDPIWELKETRHG